MEDPLPNEDAPADDVTSAEAATVEFSTSSPPLTPADCPPLPSYQISLKSKNRPFLENLEFSTSPLLDMSQISTDDEVLVRIGEWGEFKKIEKIIFGEICSTSLRSWYFFCDKVPAKDISYFSISEARLPTGAWATILNWLRSAERLQYLKLQVLSSDGFEALTDVLRDEWCGSLTELSISFSELKDERNSNRIWPASSEVSAFPPNMETSSEPEDKTTDDVLEFSGRIDRWKQFFVSLKSNEWEPAQLNQPDFQSKIIEIREILKKFNILTNIDTFNQTTGERVPGFSEIGCEHDRINTEKQKRSERVKQVREQLTTLLT